MDEFGRQALAEWQGRRSARRRVVAAHAVLWASVNALLVVVWQVTGGGFPWFVFPLMGWLVGLAMHASAVFLLRSPDDAVMSRALRDSRRRALPGPQER